MPEKINQPQSLRRAASNYISGEPLPYSVYGAMPYGEPYGEGASLLGPITPERIVRILLRKWLTILLSTAFGLAAAVFLLVRTVPVYSAKSTIEVKVRQPRILSEKGAVLDDVDRDAEAAFKTRIEKLRGALVLSQAVARVSEAWKDQPGVETNIAWVLSQAVTLTPKRGTRLVEIVAEHHNAGFAASCANAYAEAAETSASYENQRMSDSAVAWLQKQAEDQREKLNRAEQALIDFRAKNNIGTLEGDQKSAEQSLLALNGSLVELEKKEILGREMSEYLKTVKVGAHDAGSLPADLPRESEIREALKAVRTAMAAESDLSLKYTAQHPDVVARKADVDAASRKLAEEMRMAADAANNSLQLLQKQLAGVRERIQQESSRLTKLEQQIVERKMRLTAMERERDVADVSYKGVLNRIEEARMSADEDMAVVKCQERATVPRSPVRPKTVLYLAAGIMMGLMFGFVLGFVTEVLQDHITSSTDLERETGFKVLGLLPRVRGSSRGDLATAALTQEHPAFLEAVAGIRSLLNSPTYRDQSKVLVVASAVPGEGKTILACNLAMSIAQTGTRTLLVDFDMRRPRLQGILSEPSEDHSLLHALSRYDPEAFDGIVLPSPCPNLDMITSHPDLDLNVVEIMGNPIVAKFIEWAKSRYDRVVIDSPPFGLVSDAGILATLASGVVLVCRPEKSRRRGSQHALQHFAEMGATVLGVIVNDVDFTRHGYFSNYRYSDSYQAYQYKHGYYGAERGSSRSRRRERSRALASSVPAVAPSPSRRRRTGRKPVAASQSQEGA